jgi:hypothetical protein
MPAHNALLGQLVPRELLTGVPHGSTVWQVAAWPDLIGGMIYGFFGVLSAYIVEFAFLSDLRNLLLFIESPGGLKLERPAKKGFSRITRDQICI